MIDSGDWLKWMCEHLCRENGYIVEKPEWLEEYCVCLVDATNASKLGSSGADYRLRYGDVAQELTSREKRGKVGE